MKQKQDKSLGSDLGAYSILGMNSKIKNKKYFEAAKEYDRINLLKAIRLYALALKKKGTLYQSSSTVSKTFFSFA